MRPEGAEGKRASTFSIVAFDEETGDLGVAVQSKYVAVGTVVPWARAGVGAVATQAVANVSFGPRGLEMMERGLHPKEVVQNLVRADEAADIRQVGTVDSLGRAAAFTGKGCYEWAGHTVGRGFCALGNLLASEEVVEAMAGAYEVAEGDLPERLIAALEAGQMAGGDRRGQQSAALLVVREAGGYGGYSDRYVDIRVDDHPRPIEELRRIFTVYDLILLEREDPGDVLRLEGEVVRGVKEALRKAGFYSGPADVRWDQDAAAALKRYFEVNNFENKWRDDGTLWRSIYEYMRETVRD
jgi:uncharacterized Ntn-hydrolase superfamily protein